MTTDAWPDWQVTKLDAARRQLETSIRLLFEQGDAVSVHTLAHATFGILKDVALHRNKHTRIAKVAEITAGLDDRSFKKGFNRTGNFFKHGDKDPNGVLSGGPEEENEALLSLSVELYRNLKCLVTPEIEAFYLWWRCIHFADIEDVKEPFKSWITANASRLHADERSELLKLGHELLVLLTQPQTNAATRALGLHQSGRPGLKSKKE